MHAKGVSRTKTTKALPKLHAGDEVNAHAKRNEAWFFGGTVILAQVALIIIYATYLEYEKDVTAIANSLRIYGYTRDVNVMIFFGFGFLMTFLRRYGYSAIGYTLLISSLVAQWSIPLQGWFESIEHGWESPFPIGINQMVNGLFCAGAVMISYGAILGKVTPSQMVVMGILEPVFYWINLYITILVFEGVDVGGGMTIHTFGCYFGLTVCWFLTNPRTHDHKDNVPCYSSDLFSYAGTLFLFILWPSFNAAIARDSSAELRALINTFISITASAITAFVVSRMVAEWKFEAVHIQNSTLAGGVVMGVAADLNLTPAGAMGAGMAAGLISVLGYCYLTPWLSKKLNIQDVCGIHNLHGMPGVLSCIVGIFGTLHGWEQKDVYGTEIDKYFPHGKDQAGYQVAGLFVTICIAIVGGIFTGVILRLVGRILVIPHDDYYNDRTFWALPSDYDYVVDKEEQDIATEVVVEASKITPKPSNSMAPSPVMLPNLKKSPSSTSTRSSDTSENSEDDIEMQEKKK